MEDNIIYGKNPVIEALQSATEIDKLLLQADATGLDKITMLASKRHILYKFVNRSKLDSIASGARHQGVIAFVAASKYVTVEEILRISEERGEKPFIIIAENLTDPYNLGNIIRTANASGAHGVIIPKNRSVSLTPAVAKTSAGAVAYTPVAKVTNIARTIEYLKKNNIWVTGTDLNTDKHYYDTDYNSGTAIVIGSEDAGLSRIVREACDYLVKIPMLGEIQSLNASSACAVLAYEIVRQRNVR